MNSILIQQEDGTILQRMLLNEPKIKKLKIKDFLSNLSVEVKKLNRGENRVVRKNIRYSLAIHLIDQEGNHLFRRREDLIELRAQKINDKTENFRFLNSIDVGLAVKNYIPQNDETIPGIMNEVIQKVFKNHGVITENNPSNGEIRTEKTINKVLMRVYTFKMKGLFKDMLRKLNETDKGKWLILTTEELQEIKPSNQTGKALTITVSTRT